MNSNWKKQIFAAYKILVNKSDDEDSDIASDKSESKSSKFREEDYPAFGESDENDFSKTSTLQTFWNIFNANQGVAILTMP